MGLESIADNDVILKQLFICKLVICCDYNHIINTNILLCS